MDWWLTLTIIIVALLLLLGIRMPVAFCFLVLNLGFGFFLWKGGQGFQQIVLSVYSSIGNFVISPLIAFVLLGEILFHSGLAFKTIAAVNNLMGRVPGRLGLVSVGAGVLFAALSGSSTASTAMLGTVLVPEMEKRRYSRIISMGTVMGSGGLAVIIPPSGQAVLIGSLAQVSVGAILIGGILPGILMACLYASYVVFSCLLKPVLAPAYEVEKVTLSQKLNTIVRDVLPFSIIIFAVMGCIFLGIATPTESAALGATAAFILAAANGKFNWQLITKSTIGTVKVAVMIYFIIGGAMAFSQIMAFTGATQSMISLMMGLDVSVFFIIAIMMIIVLFLGTFMDSVAIMMITIPIFMPIVRALGYSEVLFCMLLMVSIETGFLTPPFGVNLFVMSGVAPKGTTAGMIYRAATPFVVCNVIAIVVMMVFPQITLILPNLMRIGQF